jgi:zinc transport system permease protein
VDAAVNDHWLEQGFTALEHWFHTWLPNSFLDSSTNLKGAVAVVLVSLICGAVGSLVVGNRMAFFSDALAHCALAGVGLGMILGLITGILDQGEEVWGPFIDWGVPLMTVAFGVLVGLGIAFVREKTSLGSDTVIGVFFAGALGLGAILLKYLSRRSPQQTFQLENLVFGDLVFIRPAELLLLFGLAVLTGVLLLFMYNSMVFNSFNTSLARSRRLPVRLCSYLFVVLLAVIVNICLRVVGALLINALLVVPAAAAANVSRNMRQLFWLTVGLCLLSGLGGLWMSWDLPVAGSGGSIVVVSVLLFFASMLFAARPLQRLWNGRGAPASLAKTSPSAENKSSGDEPAGPTRT